MPKGEVPGAWMSTNEAACIKKARQMARRNQVPYMVLHPHPEFPEYVVEEYDHGVLIDEAVRPATLVYPS